MKTRIALAVTASLTLLATGCASSQTASAPAGNDGGDGLIINLNGPLSDPFFGAMKQGSDAAAAAFGVQYQYSAPANLNNYVADASVLFQQAIGRKPAALVVGNFIPSAFDPFIKQATAAGIPVVVVNTGIETWQSDGAIAFVGTARESDGAAAAADAARSGVKHLLCVNHAPVNPTLHQTCQGAQQKMTESGGSLTELEIPFADSGNPAVVSKDIQGHLSSHPEIDGVLTLGSAIATNAVSAVKALGKEGSIKIGTVTLSTAVLQSIKSGSLNWAVDEQAYLQGFYSVQIAAQYLKYKVRPSQPVITGGLVITKDNVDEVLAVQSSNPGLRGAA